MRFDEAQASAFAEDTKVYRFQPQERITGVLLEKRFLPTEAWLSSL
jgi:hypothetical protein